MTAPEPDLVSERRLATDAERRALASVLRMRILRLCLYEQLTNKELAERLDRHPATILHHVRTLTDQGFLLAGEVRRGARGSREVPYRATGKSWRLDFGPLGKPEMTLLDTFNQEVVRVPPNQVSFARLGVQLPEAELEEMQSRLDEVLQEYAGRPIDPGGRRMSFFLAVHPEPE